MLVLVAEYWPICGNVVQAIYRLSWAIYRHKKEFQILFLQKRHQKLAFSSRKFARRYISCLGRYIGTRAFLEIFMEIRRFLEIFVKRIKGRSKGIRKGEAFWRQRERNREESAFILFVFILCFWILDWMMKFNIMN